MMEMEQQYTEQGQQEGEEMEVSVSLENESNANRHVSVAKNGMTAQNGDIIVVICPRLSLYIF